MRTLSRRELAQMVAAVAAARALPLDAQAAPRFEPAQGTPSGYNGPLTGVTRGLDGRGLDPMPYTLERYRSAARRLRFEARTRAGGEEWQHTLRAKLTELVGGF